MAGSEPGSGTGVMADGWYMHVCDVCRLLDGDRREKMCFFCPVCDAWICEADQHHWQRRGMATAKAIAERLA